MLLLGAIIMTVGVVRGGGGQRRGSLRKKNLITYRLDELISNGIHWFCMTAAKDPFKNGGE